MYKIKTLFILLFVVSVSASYANNEEDCLRRYVTFIKDMRPEPDGKIFLTWYGNPTYEQYRDTFKTLYPSNRDYYLLTSIINSVFGFDFKDDIQKAIDLNSENKNYKFTDEVIKVYDENFGSRFYGRIPKINLALAYSLQYVSLKNSTSTFNEPQLIALSNAIKIDPDNPWLNCQAALINLMDEDIEQAMLRSLNAVKLDSNYAISFKMLGQSLVNHGENTTYNKYTREGILIGSAKYGYWEAAIFALTKAISMLENNKSFKPTFELADAYFFLGKAYINYGNKTLACSMFQKAIKIDDSLTKVYRACATNGCVCNE